MKPVIALLIVAGLLSGCGGADANDGNSSVTDTNNAVENNQTPNNVAQNNTQNSVPTTGEEAYSQRLPGANTFTCSTCHALTEPADDGIIRPGHSIGDAFGRPSYKNGQLTELRDAVNTCVTEWMAGEPLEDDDETWVMLRDYLEEQSPAESEALTFEIVEPPADVSGGDPDAGLEIFNQSCSVCHGEGGGGTNKAPPVAGLEFDPDYIAGRIRLSGSQTSPTYDGLTGGRMPFWAADRLNDQQVIDIVAYIADSEMVEPGNNINANPNNTNNSELRECESTHPKVGQSLQFSMDFHDVSGTATILDDCTIELTNFNYDGTGIDVRIYAAENGDYRNGFAISDDLLRAGGYSDETITLQLPEGRTLDEVDGLSVWCVAVGSSFGDGLFGE